MRKEVKWFACGMEVILQENDHKGGWEDEGLDYLFRRLREETMELEEILPAYKDVKKLGNQKEIIEECIDIANFAMMIASNVEKSTHGTPNSNPPSKG